MTTRYELASCPVCGSDRALQIASADDMRDELEAVWAFHTRRLRPETPPAQLNDRAFFSQEPPLRLARCTSCGTVYRSPREAAAAVTALYRDEAVTGEVMDRLFETQRAAYLAQARRLTRMAGCTGRGVEVGSFVGGFLAAARDVGWEFEGVDVNASANAYARRRGLRVADGTLEDHDADSDVHDAVAIWNCFDQLPDPCATAAAASRLLKPGGLLALRVPNGAFYARVRTFHHGVTAPVARALLAHNNLLGFPYRHGFTPASLRRLVEEAGLRTVHVHADTLVPVADQWTRPWAALEERLVKRVLRIVTRNGSAPWFELYARK